MEAAKNSALDNQSGRDMVLDAASQFTEKFVNHAITSKTALESLFTDAGMQFHCIEYHKLDKMSELSGPSVPSDAEFAHIIVEKCQP
jgi:hypothetical protein